jgi:hypothetical protein
MLTRFAIRLARSAHTAAKVQPPLEKPQASAFTAYPVNDSVYGLSDEQKMVIFKIVCLIN